MIVNVRTFLAAFFTVILLGSCAIYDLLLGNYAATLVFALLCIPFVKIALQDGSVVKISKAGVELYCPGHKSRRLHAENIAEIGVVGLKVFHGSGKKKRYGTKYIYFSPQKLSDDECLSMCLNWPPRDKIYMRYSFERIQEVQSIFARELHIYNADDIEI